MSLACLVLNYKIKTHYVFIEYFILLSGSTEVKVGMRTPTGIGWNLELSKAQHAVSWMVHGTSTGIFELQNKHPKQRGEKKEEIRYDKFESGPYSSSFIRNISINKIHHHILCFS